MHTAIRVSLLAICEIRVAQRILRDGNIVIPPWLPGAHPPAAEPRLCVCLWYQGAWKYRAAPRAASGALANRHCTRASALGGHPNICRGVLAAWIGCKLPLDTTYACAHVCTLGGRAACVDCFVGATRTSTPQQRNKAVCPGSNSSPSSRSWRGHSFS